jgi:hypothetical protein
MQAPPAPWALAPTLAPTLALALALALPLAESQGPATAGVTLSLSKASVRLAPQASDTIEAAIANTGPLAGTVTLTATDLGPWTMQADPSGPANVPAGATVTMRVTLSSGPANDGASQRNIQLTATLTDAAGRSAQAQAQIAAQRVDPLPPAPTPWYERPLVDLGLALLVALLVAAVAAILVVRSRRRQAAFLDRETGITLALVDGPHRFGAGREMVYRLDVANVSSRPRVALVGVDAAPDGWRATPSLPRMPLSPGEAARVTFLVAPPPDAPRGATARVVLYAKPAEAERLAERVALDVEAFDVRIPAVGERLRPAVAFRR